ncbi:MAG: hypothetical protein QW113_06400 [Candidatus Bathyarchaeia archaeon]
MLTDLFSIGLVASLMPKNAELEILDLEGLPLFNQDLEYDMPETVKRFKSKIKGLTRCLLRHRDIILPYPECSRTLLIGSLDLIGIISSMVNWLR